MLVAFWALCAVLRMACWQVVAGASFMNFRNDMALGGNLATQFAATPETQARLPHLLAPAARSEQGRCLGAGLAHNAILPEKQS